jgi:outer membrane lipopolysaccharide assembly protein LptE/RlpB
VLYARDRTRRAAGDTAGAAADFRLRGEAQLAWGDRDPATIALALQALDEHSDIEQLVEDELTLARVFVADRAVGIALRARGLLMRGDAAIAALREAVQVVADSPARLEYARTAG